MSFGRLLQQVGQNSFTLHHMLNLKSQDSPEVINLVPTWNIPTPGTIQPIRRLKTLFPAKIYCDHHDFQLFPAIMRRIRDSFQVFPAKKLPWVKMVLRYKA